MKELKELDLSQNNFSEGLPDVVSNISKLKKLKVLSLSYNNFSKGLPDVVGNIGTLNELHLIDCSLTELPERYVEYYRVLWVSLCWKQQNFLTVVFTLLYCEDYSICMFKFINAAFIFGAFRFSLLFPLFSSFSPFPSPLFFLFPLLQRRLDRSPLGERDSSSHSIVPIT